MKDTQLENIAQEQLFRKAVHDSKGFDYNQHELEQHPDYEPPVYNNTAKGRKYKYIKTVNLLDGKNILYVHGFLDRRGRKWLKLSLKGGACVSVAYDTVMNNGMAVAVSMALNAPYMAASPSVKAKANTVYAALYHHRAMLGKLN